MRLGLIDEYRISVNPLLLGSGKLLFEDVGNFKLNLIEAKALMGGVVVLRYEPAKS
jgi:dihydrofolate reductase